MAARNLFDFLEKSNKFLGRKQSPTSVQSRFLKISVYYLSIRISFMHELDAPPAFFDEEFFRLLYNLSELNNFTAREIKSYMRSLYAESDYANTIDYAEQVGEARGIEKGIAIGEERTLARRNAEIVTAMLTKGIDMELICEITRLTPEEVEKLRQ